MLNHLKQKYKLGLSISILLIISSGLVIYLSIAQVNKLKKRAAKSQLEQAYTIVDNEISSFMDPVYENVKLVHEWGKTGLYENRSAENISLKLSPILEKTKIADFISISTRTEPVLVIVRNEDISWSDNFKNLSDTVSLDEQISGLLEKEAAADSIHWSKVRSFFEIDGTGISASMVWISSLSGNEYIVSFGIDLRSIADLIGELKVGEEGRVVYFEPGGRLFMPQEEILPSGEVNDTLFLKTMDKDEISIENSAIKNWLSVGEDKEHQVSFKHDGDVWWAYMTPMDDRDYGLWLGILIPEKELLDFMEGRRGILVLAFLIVLVLAVIATSLILVSSFTRRGSEGLPPKLQDLINEEAILQLIAKGESEMLEFKSTVRYNIHTGKPGKEIEIAWLKGVVAFLNSDGGVIFIGITDSGEVYGLETDNFANNDKCLLHVQNLIKQHIGLEFTRYVNFEIRTLQARQILIIECLPTNLPVFLKHNDKEQFFVRSGPSSIELPVSKALKYIEDRKKS